MTRVYCLSFEMLLNLQYWHTQLKKLNNTVVIHLQTAFILDEARNAVTKEAGGNHSVICTYTT